MACGRRCCRCPALLVGNFIALMAARKAVWRYVAALRGQRPQWDKTHHRFPDAVGAVSGRPLRFLRARPRLGWVALRTVMLWPVAGPAAMPGALVPAAFADDAPTARMLGERTSNRASSRRLACCNRLDGRGRRLVAYRGSAYRST